MAIITILQYLSYIPAIIEAVGSIATLFVNFIKMIHNLVSNGNTHLKPHIPTEIKIKPKQHPSYMPKSGDTYGPIAAKVPPQPPPPPVSLEPKAPDVTKDGPYHGDKAAMEKDLETEHRIEEGV
jgi:hypothetical protein